LFSRTPSLRLHCFLCCLAISQTFFPPGRAGTGATSKGSKAEDNAHVENSIVGSFSARSGFVFDLPFFVFKDILASLVSFVIYFDFPLSPSAGTIPAIPGATSLTGGCLRQCVHIMTTAIGYHTGLGLSSEKCETARAVPHARRLTGTQKP